MPIRILFKTPLARPSFIGHEIEDRTVISFEEKTARGFYGKFTEIPVVDEKAASLGPGLSPVLGLKAKPTVVRHTSEPFTVKLTEADLQAIASIVLTRAAEQGVGGMDATSTVSFS
jgi:hypothetical protein